MRWRLMMSVLLGVTLTSGKEIKPCWAQQQYRVAEEHPRDADLPIPDALIPSSQVAKFRLILGRLSLDPPAHIKCERTAELACGGSERVEVTACRGIPSLHYQFSSQTRNLTVNVTAAEHVRIKSVVDNTDVNEILKLDQPAQGLLELTLISKDRATGETNHNRFKIASLVHLRVSYPQLYQDHIAPTLARLLQYKPATCEAIDLVAALTDTSVAGQTLHARVDELVEELRSADRERRNGAEQELCSIGLPALCLIDQTLRNRTDLETEQLLRLRRVRGIISPKGSDNRRQLARWLASDIAYWNLVASELSGAQLQAVDQHVATLTGQPLRPQLRVADARGRR